MPKWVPPSAREEGDGSWPWKFLKSVCLEVHSVHLFLRKDYVGETKWPINKLCTKSTQCKCLKQLVTCIRCQLILKTLYGSVIFFVHFCLWNSRISVSFKVAFPHSRLVKSANPVSQSELQPQILSPFSVKNPKSCP